MWCARHRGRFQPTLASVDKCSHKCPNIKLRENPIRSAVLELLHVDRRTDEAIFTGASQEWERAWEGIRSFRAGCYNKELTWNRGESRSWQAWPVTATFQAGSNEICLFDTREYSTSFPHSCANPGHQSNKIDTVVSPPCNTYQARLIYNKFHEHSPSWETVAHQKISTFMEPEESLLWRWLSSWMLSRVVWRKLTDVSKEITASIIRAMSKPRAEKLGSFRSS
jgi:hypothetical protein